MYVYQILNKITNKSYIGITTQTNAKMRFYRHISNAKLGMSGYLYNSIRKYGINFFEFNILEKCNSIDELNYLETYYIKYFDSTNKKYGYNILKGGDVRSMPNEVKLKISLTRKNQYKNGYKNKNIFYKRKDKIKKAIQWSDEHRFKLSLAKRQYYSFNIKKESKKTICVNDGNIFDSAAKASKYYNIPITAASRVANGSRSSYKGLVFKYL